MFNVIKPPTKLTAKHLENITIFLGGSIEMGIADNWQDRVIQHLSLHEDVVVMNPRRDDWDSSWRQHPDDPRFHEQVMWELRCQENSDINCYYFDPNTKSPITLLELGLFGRSIGKSGRKTIVYCTEDFWRYGNVKMVCDYLNVKIVSNWFEFMKEIDDSIYRTKLKYFNF
jgi:hypothetical protein